MRRNLQTLGEDRACSNYRTLANLDSVHDNCAHADQTVRFNTASVQNDSVAHRHVVSQYRGVQVSGYMQTAQVLNVAAFTDSDVIDIAANHTVEPNTRVSSDLDISDDLST